LNHLVQCRIQAVKPGGFDSGTFDSELHNMTSTRLAPNLIEDTAMTM
jgi:hypothetical protein